MKRLIKSNNLQNIKQLIYLNKYFNSKILKSQHIVLSNNNKHQINVYKLANILLNNTIIKLAMKIDPIDWMEITDIADEYFIYQNDNTLARIKLTPEQFNINSVKKILPNSIKTGTFYRGISIDKINIDIHNIENSLKNNIITGQVESWTKDKGFVDEIENKGLFVFDLSQNIIVRMSANITGVHLPTFWDELLDKAFDNDIESFDERFSGINLDFNYEDEILAITPNNYKIYNLDEVEKLLKN